MSLDCKTNQVTETLATQLNTMQLEPATISSFEENMLPWMGVDPTYSVHNIMLYLRFCGDD